MAPPDHAASPARAVVIVPTFNEVENLETAVSAIFAVVPDIHVLIVDDSSPDGTGDLADRLAAADPRIGVLHRTEREGLGKAYLAGFARAIAAGYPVIIEMDADGSHPASALPALLTRLDQPDRADLVIGSRWIPGGAVIDWPAARRWLSKSANVYARLALRIDVRDSTAGFRAYRNTALETLRLENVNSRGYCFQIDMTLRVADAGLRIAEVPITFRQRVHGTSKMSSTIVVEAMWRVTAWGVARRLRSRPSID